MLKKLLHAIGIGLSVSAFFSLLFTLGFFKTWQFTATDRIFPTRGVRDDIVIIAIDNESISKIGRYPWSREVYAKLLAELSKGKPFVVGIDVAFLEEQNPTADQALASAITDSGNVVLAAEAEGKNVHLPIPILRKNASTGIINVSPDPDGVARTAPISAVSQDNVEYKHFAIEVLKTYFGKKGVSSDFSDIPRENGLIRINFAAPPGSFKEYSFSDVLEGKVVPAEFKDKIVLIGATAPDLHDNQITPLSSGVLMNGVEIHANLVQMILEKRYLVVEDPTVTILTGFVVGIVIALFLMYLKLWIAVIVTVFSLGAYVFYAIFSFDSGIIRHIIIPPLIIAGTAIADLVYKYVVEYRQKQFIRKAFSYYLSGAVLSEILSDPKKLKLGGVRQEMTVLFSDVAGFTSMSEKLNPEDLAHMLNGYLTKMTSIVFHNLGVLDKYIGDAVMAFWGAPLKEPDHAYLACKTAIEMYEEMNQIKEDWKQYDVHDFDIRIGINSGEMVVGNMGSDVRFDYTLIGDNVNLGSRLEGINKEYGTKIIISGSTYEHVKDRVVARKLDTVAVKGKKSGATIYELRVLGEPSESEKKFLEEFENARALYEKGEFKKALTAFKSFLEKYPNDEPAKIFIERTKYLIKEPPTAWDGIFIATSK